MNNIELSVIVPLYNEEESLIELSDWITNVCQKHNISFEIYFIDDGSTDSSWEVIHSIAEKDTRIKGISFRRNYGKSAALNTGFSKATGNVVITMDADLQDNPNEIPELMKMITQDGFDIVSGWKKDRRDPISKTIPTKYTNFSFIISRSFQ